MLMFLIAVGALLGAGDCILGNRFGLGEKFEEGFLCLGAAALNMVGIICIAPVIGRLLQPFLVPVYDLIGADPAMFGSLFANNMGGYPLAMMLARQQQVGLFSGLVVSSMLGAALVYTIPVGMGLIRSEDQVWFARGVMMGMIPIPVGAWVGGLFMKMPLGLLFRNSIPTIFIAILLVFGFLVAPQKLLNGFLKFAKGMKWVGMASLGAAAFTSMTGIVLVPGMADIEEAMDVIASMGIIQLGSLPLAALFIKAFRKPLENLGTRVGVDAVAMASLPVSCVNVISTLTWIKDMTPKGIVLSSAWFTSTICVFTAHLSYTSAMAPEMVTPVIAAKLVAGSLAAVLVLVSWKEKRA